MVLTDFKGAFRTMDGGTTEALSEKQAGRE